MRYISQIIAPDRKHVPFLEYDINNIPDYRLLVASTDADKITDCALSEAQGCFGFTPGVVMVHTRKTATFHKHIVSAHMLDSHLEMPLSDTGYYNVFESGVVEKALSTIDIHMRDNQLYFMGNHGSVTAWACLSDHKKYIPFYDILCMMCKAMKCNLMQYKTIQFSNPEDDNFSVIELAQTDEAKRFYMKMWLDVIKE